MDFGWKACGAGGVVPCLGLAAVGAFVVGAVVAAVALEDDGGGSAEAGLFAVADGAEAWAFAGHDAEAALAGDGVAGHLPHGGDVAGEEDDVGGEDGIENV